MDAKALARRWFEEVWNEKRRSTVESMMAEKLEGDGEGGFIDSRDAFLQQHFEIFHSAFPDLRLEIEGITAEGDDAVVRWRAGGTHLGKLAHLEPTQRKVRFSGMSWMRFREGRMVAAWDRWNANALFELLHSGTETHTARLAQ